MPQAAAAVLFAFKGAAIAAGTAVVSGGLAVGLSAGVATALGNFTLGVLTFGSLGGIAGAIGGIVGTNLLTSALSPKPKSFASQNQLNPVASTSLTPMYMAFGRTATGGTIMTPTPLKSGSKSRYASVVYRLSKGTQGVVDSVLHGDETVTFDSNGRAVGKYAGKMWLNQRPGTWTQTAININNRGGLPSNAQPSAWTSNHRCLGDLHCMITYLYGEKEFSGGIPNPTFVIDIDADAPVDPRTGVVSTTNAQRRNPIVRAYQWKLGYRSPLTDVLFAGFGHEVSEIDTAHYAFCANLADSLGYECAGMIDLTQNKYDIEALLLQAAGAVAVEKNGLQSLVMAAPRSTVGVVSEDDLAGTPTFESAAQFATLPNTIIPKFISETAKWQFQEGSPVTNSAWLTADGGILKSKVIEYPYAAGGGAHVGKLAAYDGVNAREPLRHSFSLKPQARYIGFAGDCVTLQFPTLGLPSHKVAINARSANEDFTTQIDAVSETDSKHDYATGQTTTPPTSEVETGFDSRDVPVPESGQWAAEAVQIAVDGGSLPIIRVTGSASDYPFATNVLFWLRLTGSDQPWLEPQEHPPLITSGEFRGLTPFTSYVVGVSYRGLTGVPGPIIELPSVLTGELLSGGLTPQNANRVAGGAPVYNPDRPATGWLGPPLSARWQVVSTTDLQFTQSAWQHIVNGPSENEEHWCKQYAVEAGETVSVGGYIALDAGLTGTYGYVLRFFDSASLHISSVAAGAWASSPDTGLANGQRFVKALDITVPEDAVSAVLGIYLDGVNGSGRVRAFKMQCNRGAALATWNDVATTGALRDAVAGDNLIIDGEVVDPGRIDNEAVASMSAPPPFVIGADWLGSVVAGQLPRTLAFKRMSGTSDVSASSTWSYAVSGATWTTGAGGEIIVNSLIARSISITATSIHQGVVLSATTTGERRDASRPEGGGAGASAAEDTSFNQVSSTSYDAPVAGPLTVRSDAMGITSVSVSAIFLTESPVETGLAMKAQWRPLSGGAWADVGFEVEGFENARGAPEVQFGSIELAQQFTSPPMSDVEVQLLARRVLGGGTITFPGGQFAVRTGA